MQVEHGLSSGQRELIAQHEKTLQKLRQEFAFENVRPVRDDDGFHFPPGHLQTMGAMVDPTKPISYVSHRPFLGPLIVFAKRLVFSIWSPLAKVLLKRQILFNEYTMAMASSLILMDAKIMELQKQLKELQQKQ